jgi:hypothetical protein
LTYSVGSWSWSQVSTIQCYGQVVVKGRNDDISRLYSLDAAVYDESTVFERTWNGTTWDLATCGTRPAGASFGFITAGYGRNDAKQRIYLIDTANGGTIYELSYNAGSWVYTIVAQNTGAKSLVLACRGTDTTARLYAALNKGIAEYTYNGSWTGTSFISTSYAVQGMAIGNGRNDGINRIYVTGDDMYVHEYTAQ